VVWFIFQPQSRPPLFLLCGSACVVGRLCLWLVALETLLLLILILPPALSCILPPSSSCSIHLGIHPPSWVRSLPLSFIVRRSVFLVVRFRCCLPSHHIGGIHHTHHHHAMLPQTSTYPLSHFTLFLAHDAINTCTRCNTFTCQVLLHFNDRGEFAVLRTGRERERASEHCERVTCA
jgi:hypothetical protein